MRYSIVLFCLAAFTSAAGAHPRPVEKPQPFFTVIFVQDGDNRFGEADGAERKAAVANNCRSDPEGYNRPECLRYLRKAKPQISNAKSKREQTPPPPAKQATAKAQSRGESEQSDKRLANFVGQLLLAGFDGKEPVDPEVMRVAGALHDGALSGVFIRSSNVANAAQLRRLLGSLQHETKDKPPLIAIEQPGGPDSTLSEEKGFTYFASANVVASHANPYEAQLVYREMAGELAALGVTLNIGASADTCPEQGVSLSAPCFGTSPTAVANFANAFTLAHRDRGVLAAFRHVPYRSGLLTASLADKASSAILRDVLASRAVQALFVSVNLGELFRLPEGAFGAAAGKGPRRALRGVVIIDLRAEGSGCPCRYEEAIIRAFRAGADMILVSDTSMLPADLSVIANRAVRAGLKSGHLRKTRLEEAYAKVARMKAQLRRQPKMKLPELMERVAARR